jgi:glutathione S-transferase
MIVVHHLNDSRSQRILWLLEELELPYEIRNYQRDPQSRYAPASLMAVHPLGKSPLITDGGLTVHESGAITDYVIRRYGGGRLQPAPGSDAHEVYLQWLHYAEGSAMPQLLLDLNLSRLNGAGAPLQPRVDGEVAKHLGYMNHTLATGPWVMGDEFTGADVLLSFVGQFAATRKRLGPYAHVMAWIKRFQARPAYARALEKGGSYLYGV